MDDASRLLASYEKDVQFPEVSGFEVLDMLDVRSKIAAREAELNAEQRARLEKADDAFLRHAPTFFQGVASIGDLNELRRHAGAPCSHWWWYLDKLTQRQPVNV